MRLVWFNEPVASKRRVYFQLVLGDGITPALAEAGGQPQVSIDGGAWTDTGISTLNAIGFGRYYADPTQAAVLTPGTRIETRYKGGSTAECPGDSIQVVGFNPNDPQALGLTSLPVAGTLAVQPILAAAGLDQVPVAGLNLRQYFEVAAATQFGVMGGAGTSVVTFYAPNAPTAARLRAGLDGLGNRVYTVASAPP